MTLLWINLAIVFGCSFLARYFARPVPVTGLFLSVKPNKLFVLFAFAFTVAVSGLRANIGDTYFYKHIYKINDFTWDFILSEKDIGFGVLQMLLKTLLSEDPQVLIFVTAFITNVIIFIVLYNYSRMIELSLYVYITGGLFLVSMNGIRQALAGAIAFTAIKFLKEGNWLSYFIVVLVASLFHQSALILLPVYFIVRFKAWSKATVALLIFAVLIVIGYEKFSSVLFTVIEDSQYGDYKNFAEGGANSLRVAVNAVPLIIAYLGREKLKKNFPNSDFIVNMSLIGFLFMVISTQNWIFARFSMYFGLYQLILISWIVKLFREKDQKFIYFGIIVCYLAYYYYENVVSLNIMYRSDYFG
ncbi:EpsG family protein [Lentibacillus sp. N15]|uniref:EpsG family protein n=1 Tax=Lentibacillus songyuanensis TaxID=3136161 RepID=UPI0031BB38D5